MPDDSRLSWVREESPVWDADKVRIIGGAPEGAFVLTFADAEALPGDWWSARDSVGTVVGYGRLDTTWGGDAEILLAVDADRQQSGIGTFILDHLDAEAADRGLNYISNRIRDHEQRDLVHDWLVVRGFRGPIDGDLRKLVGRTHATPSSEPSKAPSSESSSESSGRPAAPPSTEPAGERSATQAYDPGQGPGHDPADQAPGNEEQGGYVDVEEHQY